MAQLDPVQDLSSVPADTEAARAHGDGRGALLQGAPKEGRPGADGESVPLAPEGAAPQRRLGAAEG